MINLKDIYIQKSKSSHIDSIYSISNSNIKNSWSIKLFNEDFNSIFSEYFSLMYKNQVIGFLSVWIIIDEITITNISIHNDYRGLGLSNYLMEYLIINYNEYTILLEVRESNNIAINLYKKFNFREICIRENYYKFPVENAIIMKKF
ncbi:ribosomal-protein-alanine acetyltransferase [Candidatus Arthromitus sp. SFB-mouse-Japan]|uniref:ribosomal protein S18-alanine N-acetyltransferase n=1 Tax=unclassified Candidatus Neoarthromitus TaxID=2638829 RepID=UPI00021B8216|nr:MULTISPECIES: ribosomal protein S18-alanine N-acetyltransferase [unclassified Candidatus Arthromitus]EIA21940.1 Ribosomal-protein-alanine acetyltransferase [Candidatus Arthromitus sp. SFB-2]EIA26204.1 Ribosomal-protein-alanine acetyltransferase [Candidatus Arthromitus sp. SFB-4]EIA26667.1 Ribosomal-protein-alanine acetyltransferase [Candidatus Arthromitus sp. SFB-3]EIA27034.1 Ribosomal-protein-alanine acetyltransferase [Candidatus Arthromitus sp. SFB-co]EIA30038.1 Ribosomal-protein-alanine 